MCHRRMTLLRLGWFRKRPVSFRTFSSRLLKQGLYFCRVLNFLISKRSVRVRWQRLNLFWLEEHFCFIHCQRNVAIVLAFVCLFVSSPPSAKICFETFFAHFISISDLIDRKVRARLLKSKKAQHFLARCDKKAFLGFKPLDLWKCLALSCFVSTWVNFNRPCACVYSQKIKPRVRSLFAL